MKYFSANFGTHYNFLALKLTKWPFSKRSKLSHLVSPYCPVLSYNVTLIMHVYTLKINKMLPALMPEASKQFLWKTSQPNLHWGKEGENTSSISNWHECITQGFIALHFWYLKVWQMYQQGILFTSTYGSKFHQIPYLNLYAST